MEEFFEENPRWAFLILIIAAIALLIFGAIEYDMYYDDPHWEQITVKDKGVDVADLERWLIYTEDETYSVTDLILAGFFESSDVYNSLEVGKTYKVYVSGQRRPFFSGYKVIRLAVEQ